MVSVRIALETFGCRVNQYESDMMRDRLAASYEISEAAPDVVLLNACTVTALAERKARQAARRIRRTHPHATIVLIGCLADAVDQGTTRFDEADLLAGNAWKPHVDEVVRSALSGRTGLLPARRLGDLAEEHSAGPVDRVRAFLKIQDGCHRSCAYCRTTQVRGPSRSKPLAAVRAEARDLVDAGFPELVLTGINLAEYASDDHRLADVVDAVAATAGLRRLRLASLNPEAFGDDLIRACAEHSVVSPHVHIPLQSGDDEVLRAMQRGYSVRDYLEAVDRIRHRIPHATFGTDLIVGFPGEDEAAFAGTVRCVETVGYVNLHVFRYSPRPGTAAARLKPVPSSVQRMRSERLSACWETTVEPVLDNRIGTTQDVLVEEHREAVWRGYTHDYLHVRFHSDRRIPIGSISSVRITGRVGATLEGVDDDRDDTR